MTDLNERIANLSPEKRAILERELMKADTTGINDLAIPRRTDSGACRVSFAQERMWLLNQMVPDSPVYNMPKAFRINGTLDVEALEKSLHGIVSRHEVLRTTISLIRDTPMQIVADSWSVPLPVIDLVGWAEADREAEVLRVLVQDARRPFDLSRDVLFRAILLRLDVETHVLQMVLHHGAFDGSSARILFQELGDLYESFSTGAPSSLSALPIQYADYAQWQRRVIDGENLESLLSYWKGQLGENRSIVELPADKPRSSVRTFSGSKQTLMMPKRLLDGLEALSQQEGATLFMTLLAAFEVLLHRYSGSTDITIGSPVAGRIRVETEGLIGFFVNTLVLRNDLAGNPGFRDLLASVRDISHAAYAHQDLPFEKVVEELNPHRDLSRNPLFQIVFAFQNYQRHSLAMNGLEVTPIDVDMETSQFDLSVFMESSNQGLSAKFEYNTDLFEDATIRGILNSYEVLLESIVDDPDSSIHDLPLLHDEGRRSMLSFGQGVVRPYPLDQCVHEVFEAHAERDPQAIAVTFDEERLTYGELNAKANQLAHYLQSLGVQHGTFVGIYVERSPDAVVAMLGVIKAGGAYVPLSPMDPAQRMAFMLEDTDTPLVLATTAVLEELPRQDAKVVWLDSDQEAIGLMSVKNPVIEASAESLAYVMYTSGSTGRPKGALIPHRAINRLVCNTDYVELGPSDVVAQVSNLAFDASTFEVWGALLNGARLEIIPNNVVLSPHSFSARLRDADVTTMFLTTALFEQLAREVPDAFGSIQNLLFGGETATPRWVRQVLETAPPKRLIHVYGPTESTTFATWQHVHIVKEGSKSIPIGRAIANTDVYILDQGLRSVPAGAVGEIFIGGEGLAQGYLNRPDLTAERFISDPFGAGSDYRLYRTGDLARYLPDGEIDLVGRVDDQVKIRGFRVEPGEVRSALIRHPGVRDSIVLAQEDRAAGSSVAIESNKRLVAYVVGEDGFELTVTELRRFLRESVPDYMVPSAFALLDELPISANGKVDRERLPPPEPADSVSRENVVEPRDEIERRLRSLWNKTLSLSRVSVHDSFFDLGGHSLLAASLLSKINQLFDKNLTLTTLFKAPTIAQLADEIRCEGWTQPTSSVIEVQPHGSNPPFFCVASAIFICYNLAGYLGIEQPLYEVNLPPLDPRELPFTRMEAQVAQFVDDIRAVQPEGPYYIGGFSRGGVVAFEIARQLREQGHEVAILAIIDTSRPGFHGAEVRDRQTANQYTQRIDFHKIQLRQLDLKDRLTYSSALLRRMVAARVKYPMQRLTRKAAYHVARKLGRRVPGRFENRWFVRHEAIWYGMGYTKQTYHGDVTLIRSGSRRGGSESAALGWDEVVDGRLEVEYVPGKHTDIFVEPNVQELAQKLSDTLAKARLTVHTVTHPAD